MGKKIKNVCHISPLKGENSETFIKAHLEHLQCNFFQVYGNYPDLVYGDKKIKEYYTIEGNIGKLINLLPYYFYWRLKNKDSFKKSFKKFLLKNSIDIVFAEYGWTAAIYYNFIKDLNIPLIIHFYGIDAYQKTILEKYKNEYKEMFDYANYIITVSNDMTEQLVTLGADKNKIVYNPCAPNSKFYHITPEFKDNFIAIGRFTESKCPHHTILAFKKVVEEYPNARLTMIGDGNLFESSVNLVNALKLSDKINFTGTLKHFQTLEHIKNACCFVQHSIKTLNGDSEGTPVAILEAGAASLPVVSTKHAGIKESVLHTKTGFLVEENDIDEMAKYMLELIKNKNLCKTMGLAAREYIKSKYDFTAHISNIQNLIDGI